MSRSFLVLHGIYPDVLAGTTRWLNGSGDKHIGGKHFVILEINDPPKSVSLPPVVPVKPSYFVLAVGKGVARPNHTLLGWSREARRLSCDFSLTGRETRASNCKDYSCTVQHVDDTVLCGPCKKQVRLCLVCLSPSVQRGDYRSRRRGKAIRCAK